MKNVFLISLLIIAHQVFCQDAYNFSEVVIELSANNIGGSARILGLGEAQTAIGGDVSSISSNPAGLGFFNKSEFSITSGFNFLGSSTTYRQNQNSDERLNFNIGNLGWVRKSKYDEDKFLNGSFGLSLNRIADFQKQIQYSGSNYFPLDENNNILLSTDNFPDIIDFAVYNSFIDFSGTPYFHDDIAELAHETYLIDPPTNQDEEFLRSHYYVDENGVKRTFFPTKDSPVNQNGTIDSRGSAYQISFAYGANYNDIIYFGASIGLITLNKEVKRQFFERPPKSNLLSVELNENYSQNGNGINITTGLILRPTNNLLFGLSYLSSTYHTIRQNQNITMISTFTSDDPYDFTIEYNPLDFDLRTPSKLRVGATYFYKKHGFITGQIERINYANASLKNHEDGTLFDFDMEIIRKFNSALNYNIGVEFRHEQLRFRGGYNFTKNPKSNSKNVGRHRVSLGSGIRNKNKFFDIAVLYNNEAKNTISPYPTQLASVRNRNIMIYLTFGKFLF